MTRMWRVRLFKYLGSVMSKDGGMEDEMQERVQQGKRVVGRLKAVTRNRAMRMELKKTLHDSVVIPTLTYGSEAWTMMGRHKSRVRGVELSYLRSTCEVTWRDRLTKEEVRERCGVDVDVLESVIRNTLRWFSHVEHMGSERLIKKVYESKVEGQRGRGKPRVRWKDGIERYMSEGGVGWEEGRQLTGNRNVWRQFICGHHFGD